MSINDALNNAKKPLVPREKALGAKRKNTDGHNDVDYILFCLVYSLSVTMLYFEAAKS